MEKKVELMIYQIDENHFGYSINGESFSTHPITGLPMTLDQAREFGSNQINEINEKIEEEKEINEYIENLGDTGKAAMFKLFEEFILSDKGKEIINQIKE